MVDDIGLQIINCVWMVDDIGLQIINCVWKENSGATWIMDDRLCVYIV